MDFLIDLGIIGFLFFLIKGLLWLGLFALAYFGLIKKEKLEKIRTKLKFFKRKQNQN